jgi:hypothetical protein
MGPCRVDSLRVKVCRCAGRSDALPGDQITALRCGARHVQPFKDHLVQDMVRVDDQGFASTNDQGLLRPDPRMGRAAYMDRSLDEADRHKRGDLFSAWWPTSASAIASTRSWPWCAMTGSRSVPMP